MTNLEHWLLQKTIRPTDVAKLKEAIPELQSLEDRK